ncbi:MAG TPA: hypothetical protein VGM82_09700 [Gemmatimonadaceae bacterium]
MVRDAAATRAAGSAFALGVFALLFVVASCAQPRGSASTQVDRRVGEDSIVGTLAVVAAALDERVVIRTATGVHTLVATRGADSAALRRLSAVDIVARGRSDGDRFVVSAFVVRRVDGQPVVDGVLRLANGRLFVDNVEESREVGHPSPALLALVGARVWLSGSLETGPSSFGVIELRVGRNSVPRSV